MSQEPSMNARQAERTDEQPRDESQFNQPAHLTGWARLELARAHALERREELMQEARRDGLTEQAALIRVNQLAPEIERVLALQAPANRPMEILHQRLEWSPGRRPSSSRSPSPPIVNDTSYLVRRVNLGSDRSNHDSPDSAKDSLANGERFRRVLERGIRQVFKDPHDCRYMTGTVAYLSQTVCSFCSGVGHLPHKCASKRNVDEAMRSTGNAAMWGSVKRQYKEVKYHARRAARREYTRIRTERDEWR